MHVFESISYANLLVAYHLFELVAEVFNHHLHLSGSEEMLLLGVAQFVKHGDGESFNLPTR